MPLEAFGVSDKKADWFDRARIENESLGCTSDIM